MVLINNKDRSFCVVHSVPIPSQHNVQMQKRNNRLITLHIQKWKLEIALNQLVNIQKHMDFLLCTSVVFPKERMSTLWTISDAFVTYVVDIMFQSKSACSPLYVVQVHICFTENFS